jgi:L,D-transpeptidase YcbB
MLPSARRFSQLVRIAAGCALSLTLLSVTGCKHIHIANLFRHRKSVSQPNTADYSDDIQERIAGTQLPILRWPNFSDYQQSVQTFYDDRNEELAWTRDGKPTAAAIGFIEAFLHAGAKGLNPEDYDASRWSARIGQLASKPDQAIPSFDVAMTVCVMRFISDLRVGRVNPQHFNFDINIQSKRYDLAEFLSDHAVDATDVPTLIASVEPDSDQYRKTEQALAQYLDLAKEQQASDAHPLPTVVKALKPGEPYPAATQLLARLQLEGDASSTSTAPVGYTEALSAAVMDYQRRHGLTDDGRLTPQTIASLNVPLTERVIQLQNSLERWRWLPDEYLNAPLQVNLPEFVLRGYTPDHQLDFTMRVVVGQQLHEHNTPVFTHLMKYLIFRPYWNVPTDIAKKELVPHIAKDKSYLAAKNFEVTDSKGNILTNYTAWQVAQGGVLVREKPGPKNSLGLIKFMFPNTYDVYLHSTPAPELFTRSRRDFSHGCVRVQEPAKLAVWVLQNQQDKGEDWDMDKVNTAMQSGKDNFTVSLKKPIPIVIFYATAIVAEDDHVHFFDDIYGYDAEMQSVLAKGPPYPTKPEPVKKESLGDTD